MKIRREGSNVTLYGLITSFLVIYQNNVNRSSEKYGGANKQL